MSFPHNSRATEYLLSVSIWFNNEILEWAGLNGVEKDGKTEIFHMQIKKGEIHREDIIGYSHQVKQ